MDDFSVLYLKYTYFTAKFQHKCNIFLFKTFTFLLTTTLTSLSGKVIIGGLSSGENRKNSFPSLYHFKAYSFWDVRSTSHNKVAVPPTSTCEGTINLVNFHGEAVLTQCYFIYIVIKTVVKFILPLELVYNKTSIPSVL